MTTNSQARRSGARRARSGRSGAGYRQAGFTLLEVLVALVLLSLVTMLVSGSIVLRGDRVAMISLQTKIEHRFREAALAARETGEVVLVEIDPDNRLMTGPGRTRLALPRAARIDFTSAKEFGRGKKQAVAFFPDGSSSGLDITVTIGNQTDSSTWSWLGGRLQDER
jgi:general secretion pathway protein H